MVKNTRPTAARSAKRKIRQGAWFVPLRGSYIPVSWQGWLTYLPFTVYLVFSLVVGLHYTGNDLKAVLWIVPNWLAAAVAMTWLARLKS